MKQLTNFYPISSSLIADLNNPTSNSNRLSSLFDQVSKQDKSSSSLNNNQHTLSTKSSTIDSSKSSSKKKDKFNTLNLSGLNIKKSSIQRTLTKLKQLEQHNKEQQNQQKQRVRANSANSSSIPSPKEQITNLNSKLSKKQSFDSKTLSGLAISSPKHEIKFAPTLNSPITNTKVNDLRDLQEIKKALLDKKLSPGRMQTKSSSMKNRLGNSQIENHNKHIVTTEILKTNNSPDCTTNNNDEQKNQLNNKIESPQKRQVTLYRDDNLGFGFIAGSEKPLVIRFVTPG